MRILKYAVFLSILGIIFIRVYRKSDKKGLRWLLISFRAAVVISPTVSGLIPISTEPIESEVDYNL